MHAAGIYRYTTWLNLTGGLTSLSSSVNVILLSVYTAITAYVMNQVNLHVTLNNKFHLINMFIVVVISDRGNMIVSYI